MHTTTKVKCFFHSSQERTPENRKLMGGTGLIALQDTIGRIQPKGSGGDTMGRWTYLHLRLSDGRTLTVISIYQVCQTPTNKLGGTAWHQQRRALDLQYRQDEHPREAFMKDLTTLIKRFRNMQHEIIVGGDWNETITGPRSKVIKLCVETGLVDPWIHFHPHHEEFATHERGSQRIDTTLVSHAILSAIESVSYSPVGLLQNNDHRTIFLQLSRKKLFGPTIGVLPKMNERNVRSNDKASVTTYVETMYDHLIAHSTFTRAKALQDDIPDDGILVEQIDQIIGQASDQAESKCQRRRPEWFSVPLTRQRLTVSYLKHLKRGYHQNIDRTALVSHKLEMLGATITKLPVNQTELDHMIQEETKKLKDMRLNSRQLRVASMEDTASKPGQRIRKHEIALTTWKTLAFLKKGDVPPTIDRVEIPDDWPAPFQQLEPNTVLSKPKDATSWKIITNPDEIEYYLLLRNRLHFGKAHGTPFTTDPLQHEIPWGANSTHSEAILQGEYIPHEQMTTICKEVLYACQNREDTPIISAELSFESFRGKHVSGASQRSLHHPDDTSADTRPYSIKASTLKTTKITIFLPRNNKRLPN